MTEAKKRLLAFYRKRLRSQLESLAKQIQQSIDGLPTDESAVEVAALDEVDCDALHQLCLAADEAVATQQQILNAAQNAYDNRVMIRGVLYNDYITYCDV